MNKPLLFCFLFFGWLIACTPNHLSTNNKLFVEIDSMLPDNSSILGGEFSHLIVDNAIRMHADGWRLNGYVDNTKKEKLFWDSFSKNADLEIHSYEEATELITNLLTSKFFAEKLALITTSQWYYFRKILFVSRVSQSSAELYRGLSDISYEIIQNVPEPERNRLFNSISILIYAEQAKKDLINMGIVESHPIYLKTKSELDSIESLDPIVDSLPEPEFPAIDSLGQCHAVLASSIALALAEPTPVGEIIVGIALVVVAGIAMYQLLFCTSDSLDNGMTRDECIEHFASCTSPIPDGCSVCLQFCVTQGYWPPYSTHQCN